VFAREGLNAIRFVEYVRRDQTLGTELLSEVFNILASCAERNVSCGPFSPSDVAEVYQDLVNAFRRLLCIAYTLNKNLEPYQHFVEWTRTQNDWITMVTTNWDTLLDDLVCGYWAYKAVDFGEADREVDVFIPMLMVADNINSRACALYKLNGSLNWFYCPRHSQFYSPHFLPPFDLQDLTCPRCGTQLISKIYTPGVSRATLPIRDRVMRNLLRGAQHCRRLVFIGFSCPQEDVDVIREIGEALRTNPFFKAGQLVPEVVQHKGPHRNETIRRFETTLRCRVAYDDSGFEGWAKRLA
jgi:hypothetical protein